MIIFFKKATKNDEIFTVDLMFTTKRQIDGEDFINFCGLLRKHELYLFKLGTTSSQVIANLPFSNILIYENIFELLTM